MIQIVRIGQFSEPRSSSEKENSVAIFPYKHTLQIMTTAIIFYICSSNISNAYEVGPYYQTWKLVNN